MLRRYLITNAITTALLLWALSFVPSVSSLKTDMLKNFDIYAMDHAVLGPIIHRFVMVGRT